MLTAGQAECSLAEKINTEVSGDHGCHGQGQALRGRQETRKAGSLWRGGPSWEVTEAEKGMELPCGKESVEKRTWQPRAQSRRGRWAGGTCGG